VIHRRTGTGPKKSGVLSVEKGEKKVTPQGPHGDRGKGEKKKNGNQSYKGEIVILDAKKFIS